MIYLAVIFIGMGSSTKVVGKEIKFDFCGLNSIMSDFLKLMLPEGLFEYFELTSHRQEILVDK